VTERRRTVKQMQAGWAARGAPDYAEGEMVGNRSRTAFAAAGERKAARNYAKGGGL